MFDKVLIANRGEIALRIHRACREMGIQTVAVHSTADSEAMHVRLADESVCIGPPSPRESYMNVSAILTAASVTGADAIHPGVGFLSENAAFAEMVMEHGLKFIGPSKEHIRIMGDKVSAKQQVKALGLPVVPGSDGAITDDDEAFKIAKEIGYPILVKASAGGGGRGMKVAKHPDELVEAMAICRNEAKVGFGDDTVYLEKFLAHPRHIEVQVLGDEHGHIVHLGERDCSLQRRHQKILEEGRSPALDDKSSQAISTLVAKALQKIEYVGCGTVEFLYERGDFYFIEMNTRLQVEHPVTEMITGIDLVRAQINVAAGQPLEFSQKDIKLSGHAIECRITAENPETFAPSPGIVTDYHSPGGLGVRVDSAIYSGYQIPPYYDSLIAKLIVHGESRNEALMRLNRALDEYVIGGIETTIPLHHRVVREPVFRDGSYDINWLEGWLESQT